MQRELSGGGSSRYAAEGRQEGRRKGGRKGGRRAAEWRQEGTLRPSRPRRDWRAQGIAALWGITGGGFYCRRRKVRRAPFGQPKLTASAVRRAAGLLYQKLWHNKKALPLKKAALLFTKPDGRIRNIILFPPSRREILKDRAERTGMSA